MDGQPAINDTTTTSTATLASKDLLDLRVVIRNSREEFDILRLEPPSIRCFGDREVLGLVGDGGIQLLFFNPNFVPNNPEGTDGDNVFADSCASPVLDNPNS